MPGFFGPVVDVNKLTYITNIYDEKIDSKTKYYAKYNETGKIIELKYEDREGKHIVDYYTCYPSEADNPENYKDLLCETVGRNFKYGYVKKTVSVLNFDKLLITQFNDYHYNKYKPTDFASEYSYYKQPSIGGKRFRKSIKRKHTKKSHKNKIKSRKQRRR